MNSVYLPDEDATLAAGKRLSQSCEGKGLIFLHGTLGAGKTTFSRGLIQGLGHTGHVKSPTYTLVEPYELGPIRVMHYDLYRLGDPAELDYLGLEDHLDQHTLTLIEWPEKGQPRLPQPDLELVLELAQGGRRLSWIPHTPHGQKMAHSLALPLS